MFKRAKVKDNASIQDRLFSHRKIDPNTGCWLWTGSKRGNGYGEIRIKGKNYAVHRVSFEHFVGPLKKYALHKLECPNKHCFNPEHLYEGTQSENRKDEMKVHNVKELPAAAWHRNKTHCPKGHPYDEVNTLRYRNGRMCRTCIYNRSNNII